MDKTADERKFWHQGFYGAMEFDLRRHRGHLEFNTEVELGKLPPRLDLEIIKKQKDYVVDEDFGRIYRTYNIHEYKYERDGANIDELSQVTAYGYFLKHLGRSVDELPLDEITISLFRRSYPRELFKKLEQYHIRVTQASGGIYYVEGFSAFPTQIVVMKDFDRNHLGLRSLGVSISDEEALAFSEALKDLTDPYDISNARAVLNVSVAANRDIYERIWREFSMYEAVLSIFQKDIDQKLETVRRESLRDGADNERRATAERMIQAGKPGGEISMFTNLGRSDIDVIAKRLNRTVSWGETGA